MLSGLVHAHSGLRWLTFIVILFAIFNAFANRGNAFKAKDIKINLFALILMHTQVLIGLVLYFISPKVNFDEGFMKHAASRFFAMEHPLTMIIAAILITIGYSKAKKGPRSNKKTVMYYGAAIILILAMIPWDQVKYNSGWF